MTSVVELCENENVEPDTNAAAQSDEPPHKRQKTSLSTSFSTPQKATSSVPSYVFPLSLKPSKKRKVRSPNRETAENEVKQYLTREFGATTLRESFNNPLKFWLSDEAQDLFPNLAKVALKILTIPATSAAVERLFSLAKNLLSDKRLRLKTDKVGMLCLLNKALQL